MQLFIDTNVFLDYFRTNKRELLVPLKKLDELVGDGTVTLMLPEQVIQEYKRNRRSITEQMRDDLLKEKQLSLAKYRTLGVSKKEVKAVDSAKSALSKAYDQLLKKFDERIDKESTEADRIIKRLFKKASLIPESDEVIQRAYMRYMKGNPPRKANHSYGDAIVWEALLEDASEHDLTVISSDSDFTEKQSGKKKFNSFLQDEWKNKTKKKIFFHDSLGEFINEIREDDPIDEVVVEQEKKRANTREFITASGYLNRPLSEWDYLGNAVVEGSPLIVTSAIDRYPVVSDEVQGLTFISSSLGQTVKYCPYCGCEDPVVKNVYALTSRTCRSCKKQLPYGI